MTPRSAPRPRRWSTSACRRATDSIPTTCGSADAIEIVIGQGAKPGGGGMLLGSEGQPARGRACARLPEGIDQRSACAPSGLDRSGRSGDQDQGAARDHRLAEADLRQDRRHARVQRRQAGGAGGRGRGRGRRHAGRHGGDADGSSSSTSGIPTLAALRQAVDALEDLNMQRHGAAHHLRAASAPAPTSPRRSPWAPMRCAIGQGVLMALGCNSRHLRRATASTSPRSMITPPRHGAGLLSSLPHGPLPGRHHDAGSACWNSGSSPPVGARRLRNYLQTLEHGTDDDCTRLRQAGRAPLRERGPGRP